MACGCGQSSQAPLVGDLLRPTTPAAAQPQEPAAATARSLANLAGRRRGLSGLALNPNERAEEQHHRAEMAKRLDAAKQKHHQEHLKNVDAAMKHRTNAAMCAACPRVSKDGVTCTALNAPVTAILTVSVERCGSVRKQVLGDFLACPLHRHARGSRAIVRWAGLLWFGVPEPVRWLIDWRLITRFGRRPVASSLAGCGCCVPLKLGQQKGGVVGRVLGVLERAPGLRRRVVPAAAAWWARVRADWAWRRGKA